MTDKQKLAHLSRLLGEGVDVLTFARAYAQLYQEDSPGKQRADALRLFGKMQQRPEDLRPTPYAVPAHARADFNRIWNSGAPALCGTCGQALVATTPSRGGTAARAPLRIRAETFLPQRH